MFMSYGRLITFKSHCSQKKDLNDESKEVLIIAPLHNFNCDKKIVRLDENVSIRHARKTKLII